MPLRITVPLRFQILALFSASAVFAGDIQGYKLDVSGPTQLLDRVLSGPVPNRVDLYLTGPRVYIDQLDTPDRLSKKVPDLSITNTHEIATLVTALCADDIKQRVTNIMQRTGYTYHLLLRNDSSKTVMHFRVFEPDNPNSEWLSVYPRSEPKIAYFDREIAVWLHARLKPGSAIQPKRDLKR